MSHDVSSHCSVTGSLWSTNVILTLKMLSGFAIFECDVLPCGDLLLAELEKAHGAQLPIALPLLALAFAIFPGYGLLSICYSGLSHQPGVLIRSSWACAYSLLLWPLSTGDANLLTQP